MNYRNRIYSFYQTFRDKPFETSISLKSATIWYEKVILPILPEDKSVKILELGCGQGFFLSVLRSYGYRNILGVDVSEEQIEFSENLGVKGFVKKADASSFLESSEEKYHVVCAFDLLEHFYKDEVMKLLDLIHESLLPEGLFIFRVPNGEALFSGRLRYGDFTHELAFTRSSLSQILRATGFADCKFYPVKPVIHGVKSFGRRILFEIFEKILWLYLVAETGGVQGYILTQNIWGWAEKYNER